MININSGACDDISTFCKRHIVLFWFEQLDFDIATSRTMNIDYV